MASFHADFIPRSPKILLHRSSFLPLKNRKALTMHIYTYIYTHTHVEMLKYRGGKGWRGIKPFFGPEAIFSLLRDALRTLETNIFSYKFRAEEEE